MNPLRRPVPAQRLEDEVIALVRPDMALVPQMQAALTESYEMHRQFLPWATPSPSVESVAAHMAKAIENYARQETEYRYLILRRSDGRLVGCIGVLLHESDPKAYEVGYWARTGEHRKGYVSRAVTLMCAHVATTLHAPSLTLKTVCSNTASRAVAERCGFVLEERLEDARLLGDGSHDATLVYRKHFVTPAL